VRPLGYFSVAADTRSLAFNKRKNGPRRPRPCAFESDPLQTKGDDDTKRSSATALTVATYNANGVNGRLPRLLEWLRETGPDLVCLQELKTDDTKFPARAIHEAGYGAIWHGQRAHHGVAILAKGETPKELRRGLPGEPSDNQTRYLETEAKGLVIASTYLPNGTPSGHPISITSSSGSSVSSDTRKDFMRPASRSYWLAI
jgi:hypothetical protein